MSYRDRSNKTPNVRPVIRIELSETNKKLRLAAIVLLLVIAAIALGIGLTELLNSDPGWVEIEAASQERNVSQDFTLNYYLGAGERSATDENRQISALYSRAAEDAFRIFSSDTLEDGVYNVAYLNAHPNETVTVDENLYQALELLDAYGSRYAYLAPVYVEYDRIFSAESEAEAANYDPAQNPERLEYISQAASYASDPAMIDVKLLGDNQVCLTVSQDYLAFCTDYGIETWFDFGWMTNAFIADYIAGILADNGYTRGYLVSYDGFTRNLDASGTAYSLNIFDRHENSIYLPAVMEYSQPISIVSLRNYPMSARDKWHYYTFSDGTIATTFLDPADGICKSAVNNIVSYSGTQGCAEILMQTAPVFIADNFDADMLNALTDAGIYSIWGEDTVLYFNDADLSLLLSTDAMDVTYSKEYALG